MNESGYVTLIQYQPDAGRLEVANVGIILFCPQLRRIEIKMAHGVGNVRKFFGASVDTEFLNDMKRGLETRLRAQAKSIVSPDDLRLFAKRLGNELVMTEPRGVAINQDYEVVLEELFHKWVEEPKKPQASRSALGRRLRSFFDRLPYQDRLRRDERVLLPEVDSIQVPYAYLNGKLNLVKPISLGEKSQDEARSWLLISQLLHENRKSFQLLPSVDVVLARADTDLETDRRTYCHNILTKSHANVFVEERLEDFQNHVMTSLSHV